MQRKVEAAIAGTMIWVCAGRGAQDQMVNAALSRNLVAPQTRGRFAVARAVP